MGGANLSTRINELMMSGKAPEQLYCELRGSVKQK